MNSRRAYFTFEYYFSYPSYAPESGLDRMM